MSLLICWDVIKYHIIQFVYHSDIFQILYRVPNRDFRRMVITELQQRCPGEILIRDTEHNLIQHLNFAEHTDLKKINISYSIQHRNFMIIHANCDGDYHNFCDELIFEFHGLNSMKVKQKHLIKSKEIYSFQMDNYSSNEQGFQTVDSQIRKILRDRAVIFTPNYYIGDENNHNYFNCNFNFPGQMPFAITKILTEIYFGDINNLLKKYRYTPTFIYNYHS